MGSSAVIVGLGSQTPLGLSWPTTAAAVRGGINAFALSDHLRRSRDGEPLKISRLGTLPAGARPFDRMKLLGAAAAQEALDPWLRSLGTAGGAAPALAVTLAVPTERPGFTADDGRKLARELMQGLPVTPDPKQCRLFSTGAEGGLAALAAAAEAVEGGSVPAVLIGGVDSYVEIDTLHWLEQCDRLAGPDQSHGLVPGEGAGFVLVCSAEAARERELPVLARIVGAGRGVEPRGWWGQDPTLGEGLTQAFQAAFEAPGFASDQVRVTYSDLNGETWRAEEWAYAYVRTGKRHASPLDHRHPASAWGDVGAATGPLLLGLATLDLGRSFDAESTALVWAASDLRPFRSACLLRGPKG